MDYLGWELERQRAALRALLGGGEPEEGEASGEEPSDWGGPSGWDGSVSAEGTRRSPASLEEARKRGLGLTGRYAEGRGEAGGSLMGAPGTWEVIREAERAALTGESGGPARLVSAELPDEEAGFPARGRRGAETGVSPRSRRYVPEEVRGTPRIGTGGAAKLWTSSGGRGGGGAERETTEEFAAEPERAAGAAGAKRSGEDLAGWEPAVEAGGAPSSGERSGGGAAAGDAPASISRDGAGMARRGGLTGTAGRGERRSRSFPWGEGWESPALRAEDGAKALSRAVQRDARRYDGGFTIY